MHQQGAYMMNASQELTFHKYGIGFTLSIFFGFHNHSFCVLSYMVLPANSMEWTTWSGQHGDPRVTRRRRHTRLHRNTHKKTKKNM